VPKTRLVFLIGRSGDMRIDNVKVSPVEMAALYRPVAVQVTIPSKVNPKIAVTATAGNRLSPRRSSQPHTGLNKKLNRAASVNGSRTPLPRYNAAMTTAIEASVNIQDDLAMSSGFVMGSSPLSCMFDFPVYQGLSFQPRTMPIPKQQSATTAGF